MLVPDLATLDSPLSLTEEAAMSQEGPDDPLQTQASPPDTLTEAQEESDSPEAGDMEETEENDAEGVKGSDCEAKELANGGGGEPEVVSEEARPEDGQNGDVLANGDEEEERTEKDQQIRDDSRKNAENESCCQQTEPDRSDEDSVCVPPPPAGRAAGDSAEPLHTVRSVI